MSGVRDNTNIFANIPPRAVATDNRYAWQTGATAATASSLSIWGGYSASQLPKGKVWMEFEATVKDAYFLLSRTATTASTVNTGTAVYCTAGAGKVRYLVDRSIDLYIDVIATGTGAFKWRMCSAEVDRTDI